MTFAFVSKLLACFRSDILGFGDVAGGDRGLCDWERWGRNFGDDEVWKCGLI